MYGGPLSRSNYQTYGALPRKVMPLRSRPSTQANLARAGSTISNQEVSFHNVHDENYQEMNKIATEYNIQLTKRQLVTGMNKHAKIAMSSKNLMSLSSTKRLRPVQSMANLGQANTYTMQTQTSDIDMFQTTL